MLVCLLCAGFVSKWNEWCCQICLSLLLFAIMRLVFKAFFLCGLLCDGVGVCCCAFGLCSLLFCVFVCAFVTYRVELHDVLLFLCVINVLVRSVCDLVRDAA